MKKNIIVLVFVCLIDLFFATRMSAQTPAPTPTPAFLYYCLNETAAPLSATPSGGGTLRWYTTLTGGTFSTTAPTPPTNVAATGSNHLKYFVTQVIGGVESTPRTEIDVYVEQHLSLFCVAGTNSIFFDFANTGQSSFTYSYTIDGGTPITGTHNSPSNLMVSGLNEGQTVVFTLTAVGAKACVTPETTSCKTICSATVTTPNFAAIGPLCEGSVAPVLGPTSPNGISGTWSPATINTALPGTVAYTFTPNPTSFPCANQQVMNITINAKATPVFNSIPSTVCQSATAPVLPLTSDNATPITGTWTPSAVNTAILGPVTYTFTPNAGQCVVVTPTTATITVLPNAVNPNFAPISPICIGSNPPTLSTVSPAGIVGTWSPSTISTTAAGTSSYTFTPDPNQCAVQQTLSVTITPKTVTNFTQIAPFCAGSTAPTLGTTSPNGVSGSWSPTVVDNMASGTYIFTPNSNECAIVQTMNIIVNQPINPGFNDYTICSGSVAPNLDTTSPYGVTGTWNPSAVDNLNSDSYTFTPDPGQCAVVQTIDVTVLPSNTLTDFSWTVTEAFVENQKITITADAANGDYSYQLDDGPLQSSPVFEYVSSGLHSVTVVENSGCSNPITKTDILVINYPKYFTPNNDGYNDYWNIKELASQPYAYIRIFDRYGKFLKQISPNGTGWNGTYNGHFLPADDYWFVIHYMENDVVKEFKSHFALKR
ncbi:T9SS type B sorting domain-containing protein [Flavobacterium nitratireducens]|uniref:T9SS type B sorting domain-containing protein n=1 Tax=Flavobacterium nitratireducens TaxID=992289 RepID=UPI0024158C7D|nr:T9SS type B sorting domain-containing protein [Flavobacterium nitratireducens]